MTGAALLAAALATGCALIPADTPSDSLIGEWVVEDVDNGGVIDNANLTVAFDETGRIYGSAGCNRFTGAYTYDGAFSTLKVTPLGVTRRMCLAPALMTQEHKLVQSLQAATRAETQTDGAVALTSDAGRVLLRRRTPVTQAAAKPVGTPAPVYDPSADPLAPASTVSPTALPPSSTSSYPLAGSPGTAAPLYTPAPVAPQPVGAPMSTARAVTTATPLPPAAPAPAITAVASEASRRITASGELYILEMIALPPDAVVRVQLRDVGRVGAPATVLGQQEFPASGAQPWPFAVKAPTSVIGANARLTLFAQILSGNRLLFITDTSNPVPVEGTSMPLRIRLVNAAPASSTPRPQVQPPVTTLPPTGPVTGVLPATSPTPVGAASSISYRCRNETFRIAFEDRVAHLTTADGAVAQLARIDASDDGAAPRMFSNSILTVLKDTNADGSVRVRFARGRMALTTCTPQ